MSEFQLVDEYASFDHYMKVLELCKPELSEDQRAEYVYEYLEECDE